MWCFESITTGPNFCSSSFHLEIGFFWVGDVQRAASTVFKATVKLDLKRRIYLWETLATFPIMQTFLLHVLYHLSKYHTKYFLYDQARSMSVNA